MSPRLCYDDGMTKDQIRAILDRVPGWPLERQHELAELALEIEAEAAASEYTPTDEQLRAIEEARAGGVATAQEIEAAFSRLRRA
jgi:hypothetical protein